jgi:hypothetical protein
VFNPDGQDLFLLQSSKNPIQDPSFAPSTHAGIDGVPVAKVLWQASPFTTVLHHIKQGVEQLQIGHAHVATLPRQAIGYPLILILSKFHPRHIANNSQKVQVVLTGPRALTEKM